MSSRIIDYICPVLLMVNSAMLVLVTISKEPQQTTIIPVSPQVALDLLNTHGFSNCFLHADFGTNCYFLGGSNAAVFQLETK